MTCFMQRKGENPMVFVLDTNKCLMDMLIEMGGGTCVRRNSSPCLKAGASLRKFRDIYALRKAEQALQELEGTE